MCCQSLTWREGISCFIPTFDDEAICRYIFFLFCVSVVFMLKNARMSSMPVIFYLTEMSGSTRKAALTLVSSLPL